MKYIVKIFLITGLFFASGCSLLELDDKLDNPNAVTPDNAEIALVMNNVMLEFVEFVDEASNQTMPYVRMTAMDGGDRYDNQDGPSSFDFLWYKAYADLMPDINLIIETADAEGFTVYAGIAKTMKAYILFTLVDLFGDIPYSEAFAGTENTSPKADPGADVYNAGLALLDAALNDMKSPVGSVTNDLYYGSSAAAWIKLINTLKLRYYVNTKLVNQGTGSNVKSLIDAGIISEIADDFQFKYGSNRANPDSRHPYYTDGYETGGPGWYMSNYYMWLFFGEKNTEDPRLRYYFYRQDCDETNEDFFTLDCQAGPYPSHWPDGYPFCTASSQWGDPNDKYSGYWGRDHGNDDGIPPDDLKRTAWGLYPAGGKFDADNCGQVSNSGTDGGRGAGIQPIMLASWVYFMRAEAALTMNTGEDARAMLENGVRKSIEKVKGFSSISDVDPAFEPTSDQVEAYVSEVLSSFDAASSVEDKMQVVMKEYLLALHGNGIEAYNGYRRTCKPAGMQPVREAQPGPFARSFWYPASYVNRNANATQKANVAQPVFWDTNQEGCVN